MNEKGFKTQNSVGPLVSSQERRARFVSLIRKPLVQRGSNAGFDPPSVYIGFRLLVLLIRRQGQLSSKPPRGRWRSSTQSSAAKIEDGGGSSTPQIEEPPHLRSSEPKIEEPPSSIFDFRPRTSKNPPIFDLRSRTSKNPHLQSSIFSAPNIEEPRPIFDLRLRRVGRRPDGRSGRGGGTSFRRWGEGSSKMKGGSSIFRVRSPPIFHFLGPKNEEPPPPSSSDPPSTNGHQLLSAIRRSGSSDRSSTLKIGPKVGIGPLFVETLEGQRVRCLLGEQTRRCLDPPRPADKPLIRKPVVNLTILLPFDLHSIFPDMPCMKKVYSDKAAPVQWSAARNEERPSSR